MQKNKLIADSGSTKTEWCFIAENENIRFRTQGLSPYFLNSDEIKEIFENEVFPRVKTSLPQAVYFYGTGCKTQKNKDLFKRVITEVFHPDEVSVNDDLVGAARSLCGHHAGVACILGTGSNSCYFDGEKVVSNSPGLGFILGDEGSGAVLGKSLLQHYLYDLMDDDLKNKFDKKYHTDAAEILQSVYRKPTPNRYLAAFTLFLSENRGHYMVENILRDGLDSFFYTHLIRYPQSSEYPVNFVGSIAYYFRDVIEELCDDYGFVMGKILKAPMDGLISYH